MSEPACRHGKRLVVAGNREGTHWYEHDDDGLPCDFVAPEGGENNG